MIVPRFFLRRFCLKMEPVQAIGFVACNIRFQILPGFKLLMLLLPDSVFSAQQVFQLHWNASIPMRLWLVA